MLLPCTATDIFAVGQSSSDFYTVNVSTKQLCCGECWAQKKCAAADFHVGGGGHGICHLKTVDHPIARGDGSISCVPERTPWAELLD